VFLSRHSSNIQRCHALLTHRVPVPVC
jgi:hypothetical protein